MSWQVGALTLLAGALVAGFAWYERRRPDARVVALVATLSALGALGRIAFAAVPNVKPTTDIVLIAGYALGGGPGFAVGAIAALSSNFFFGQGPWTPWQMAGWGATGVLGALLARLPAGLRRRGGPAEAIGRWPLALVCCAVGFAFTALQDVGDWVTYSDHSWAQLGAYVGSGLGFDAVHAAGCLGFALAIGPALTRSVQRFARRLQVEWVAAPAPAGLTSPPVAPRGARGSVGPGGGVGAGGSVGPGGGVGAGGSLGAKAILARSVVARPVADGARTAAVARSPRRAPRQSRQARWAVLGALIVAAAVALIAGRTAHAAGLNPAGARGHGVGSSRVRGGRAPAAAPAHVAALSRAQAARRAVDYLLAAQNPDGGFGAAPGQPSSELFSGWAALGLASAGRSPASASRGPGLLAYVRVPPASDPGSLERTILVLRAAGLPATVDGLNLVAELRHDIRADGSVADQVNWTAFAVLALRAAGIAPPARTLRWLIAQQDRDGGFSFGTAGDASDADDTGAVLEALAGDPAAAAVRARAVAYLRAIQDRDGGFPSQPGMGSNAQSTAWAVQGLDAAGAQPAGLHRGGAPSPLAYLVSLVRSDGAVDYARGQSQTPVWVTAEALMALEGKPLPLSPVGPERPSPAGGRGPGGRSAGAGSGGRGAGTGTNGPGGRGAGAGPGGPNPGAGSGGLGGQAVRRGGSGTGRHPARAGASTHVGLAAAEGSARAPRAVATAVASRRLSRAARGGRGAVRAGSALLRTGSLAAAIGVAEALALAPAGLG